MTTPLTSPEEGIYLPRRGIVTGQELIVSTPEVIPAKGMGRSIYYDSNKKPVSMPKEVDLDDLIEQGSYLVSPLLRKAYGIGSVNTFEIFAVITDVPRVIRGGRTTFYRVDKERKKGSEEFKASWKRYRSRDTTRVSKNEAKDVVKAIVLHREEFGEKKFPVTWEDIFDFMGESFILDSQGYLPKVVARYVQTLLDYRFPQSAKAKPYGQKEVVKTVTKNTKIRSIKRKEPELPSNIFARQLNHPILSKEEESELVIKYKSGDEKARERLVKCNQRLVYSIARRYQGRSDLKIKDLMQEGNIGLIKAIDKYDLNGGAKLSTYAAWWIRQSIGVALDDTGTTISNSPLFGHCWKKSQKGRN